VTPEGLEELALLRRARDHMDRHFSEPLDVAAVARLAFMSPGHRIHRA
jgi:AraC-like DNA-binding protein